MNYLVELFSCINDSVWVFLLVFDLINNKKRGSNCLLNISSLSSNFGDKFKKI